MRGLFIVIILLVPFLIFAQEERIQQNGRDSVYGRMFNSESIVTVTGKIVEVMEIPARRAGFFGIHVMVQTENETLEAHIGPASYLKENDISLRVNQNISITGSRIEMNGKPIIIASEIIQNQKQLRLRQNNGIPLWSGSRSNRGRTREDRIRN
jgi:hypothetical protein